MVRGRATMLLAIVWCDWPIWQHRVRIKPRKSPIDKILTSCSSGGNSCV